MRACIHARKSAIFRRLPHAVLLILRAARPHCAAFARASEARALFILFYFHLYCAMLLHALRVRDYVMFDVSRYAPCAFWLSALFRYLRHFLLSRDAMLMI